MKIITARNGFALVAVLGVLLVLTLLLPAMFGLSEAATYSSTLGTDKQRASYLARTMCEMSVAAFETTYDEAMEEAEPGSTPEQVAALQAKKDNLKRFLNDNGVKDTETTASTVYMYHVLGGTDLVRLRPEGEDASVDPDAWNGINDSESNIVYSLTAPGTKTVTITNQDGSVTTRTEIADPPYVVTVKDELGNATSVTCDAFIGEARCKIEYNDSIDYYKINTQTKAATPATKSEYDTYITNSKSTGWWSDYSNATKYNDKYLYSYTKLDNRNVEFTATATVNGKTQERRCILVLPTIPTEQEWLLATELGYNQIFAQTSAATSVIGIDYEASGVDQNTVHQPMYMFSCIGNMIINTQNLKVQNGTTTGDYETVRLAQSDPTAFPSIDQLSFGVYPEIKTLFERDWDFTCLSGVNMKKWYQSSQMDNFVGLTATNAIEFDMPVNLLLNPTRGNRLGDGFDANQSLFKVLYLQAPQIVFNGEVTMMLQLYQSLHNPMARRVSTILLAAPDSTPYSYERTVTAMEKVRLGWFNTATETTATTDTVKAGKVFFLDDCYIWVIPYGHGGSGYSSHWYEVNSTVWYRDKDFRIYKIANGGDVYYFNAQVEINTKDTVVQEGQTSATPFSLTAYFMETFYLDQPLNTGEGIWKGIKEDIFKKWLNATTYSFDRRTYVKDDLKYIGNIYEDPDVNKPALDKYQVIWNS